MRLLELITNFRSLHPCTCTSPWTSNDRGKVNRPRTHHWALYHAWWTWNAHARDIGIIISPRLRRKKRGTSRNVRVFQSSLHFAGDNMDDRSRTGKMLEIYNEHQEHDIRYTIQMCRWVLKSIGMWHLIYGHPSQKEKLIAIALIGTCLSLLCFVLIPCGLYTLRVKDLTVKVKLFGPIGFCLTCTIKYCYLGMRATAFGKCIRHVEDNLRAIRYQDHRRIMLKNALIGRKLITLCLLFLYTGGVSYHTIMPLSSSRKINENYTLRIHSYPGYDLFFDPQASPTYEIVFCIHFMFALVMYNVTAAACSLAAIFVTHACGQIQILMTLLDDLVEGKRNKGTTMDKRLSMIAKHHVRIMK